MDSSTSKISALPADGKVSTAAVESVCESSADVACRIPDLPSSIARPDATGGTVIYELVKRLLDIIFSGCLLVLVSPLMLLIAVAIKLESPGPVFFRHRRTGRYGKPFIFIKFRSLTCDQDHTVAHREFMRQVANGDNGNGHPGLNKPSSNSRVVTKVGRFLRRCSLDELPQLWNILQGDMSFVGPRAWPEYELENYQDWHYRRLEVPPGLTGLAQVNGRSRLSYDEMIRLDIKYIEQRSLLNDLKILLKTFPVVISGKDAG